MKHDRPQPEQSLEIGDSVLSGVIKASDLYPNSPKEDLPQILCTFNYEKTLITLAWINLLLQLSGTPSERLRFERLLREKFCNRYLRGKIERKGLTEHLLFNRESTLRLLSESARVAAPRSTRDPSPDAHDADARHALARCYLIANESIGANIPDAVATEEPTEEQRKAALVGFIPGLKYAVRYYLGSNRFRYMMVRSKEFLTRFLERDCPFDVDETFSKATGLTLEDYQNLIFSLLAVPLSSGEGGQLIDTKGKPSLTPLYNKLLPHTCISIDDLACEAAKPDLTNDFRLWKEKPLVKISEAAMMCIDIGFLTDKLETGTFWLTIEQLNNENPGSGQKMIRLRGEVFEDYASSIIERGINAQTSGERCIIQPKYLQEQTECTDIAVCGWETLILLECKAPLVKAEALFSGDVGKFDNEIREKIIEGKGIEQLWNAIQTLGHTNQEKRGRIEGIDISKVKKIYPVLVLLDNIFSLPEMNWLLDSEFQRFVQRNDLEHHLDIMPLTVLTIEDLEFLEPYLSDTPFHVHLEKWIQIATRNRQHNGCPFSEYLRRLRDRGVRQNTYIDQEFSKIRANIKDYFSSHFGP